MNTEGYQANFYTAISYLKMNLKEEAISCLNRAYGQVSEESKTKDNAIFFQILTRLAIHHLESSRRERARAYIEEGLGIKMDDTDLLFLKMLLLLDDRRFDEMLEAIIHYVLSLSNQNNNPSEFLYSSGPALDEVFDNLLPTAYQNAINGSSIRGIVERLARVTQSPWMKRAEDIMAEVDQSGSISLS